MDAGKVDRLFVNLERNPTDDKYGPANQISFENRSIRFTILLNNQNVSKILLKSVLKLV